MPRYPGQRRDALLTEPARCRRQITDRLALAWPAALAGAAAPLFTRIVRGLLPRWGGQRVCHRIVARFHAALVIAAVRCQPGGGVR